MVTSNLTALQRIDRVCGDLGMSDLDLAAALAISPNDLAAWRAAGAVPSREASARLDRLATLANGLLATFVAEDVPAWLRHGNRYLQGRTPLAVLRAGDLDRVEGALEVVDAGIFL
jgi:hypothetical protein